MKLYWSKGSCSLASHITLEEASAKFESQGINLRESEQKKPEFLKINPKGKVPTLELDGGKVLTENPAIITYVSDTHPGAKLLPAVGELSRYRALEWLAWCASTVHVGFGPLFRNKDDATARETTQLNLDRFDQWLGGNYVLGDQFSAADAYTIVFYLWGKSMGFKIGPRMQASVKKLIQRDGVKRALATQGLTVEV
ncbi:MAG: Glyoxalase family protein [Myxococcales bacterium]|nr:Glyoxalase family protein [Myxococcales bacterium]